MSIEESIEVIDGVEMYCLSDIAEMDPFLMTIVSNSDLWMFVSSWGGLTAGRVDPGQSLFPYETDDRLHQVAGRVGPVTLLRIHTGDGTMLWEPFAGRGTGGKRTLCKSLLGSAIVFREEHPELNLAIRYRWAPSDRFGWVRTVTLEKGRLGSPIKVEILDGLVNVMPWGIGVTLQQQMSNLANAYRRSEVVDPGIGIFSLEALIIDRPEPAEALRANAVWSTGLEDPALSVNPADVARFRQAKPVAQSLLITGRPGAFLLRSTLDLEPEQAVRWHVVGDVAQTHGDLAALTSLLRSAEDVSRLIDDDIALSASDLAQIIAAADGFQSTASRSTDAHHFANTLFNVMRGGTPVNGYAVAADRFRQFVAERNRPAAARHVEWLAALPPTADVDEIRARADEQGDPDLIRLAHEYLPFGFSRRHGDPSRPWNQFAIRVREKDGSPRLSYQGNWRDIFQNWEALTRSFPEFLPSIIAKFLNASTADGYNPYRITDEGIDWEVLEPDNPWSGIGYWGDHQIVYLYRLLRAQEAHSPGWLASVADRPVYSFADVPYRIVPYEQLVQDPRATVDYDFDAETAIAGRVAAVGADGKLAPDGSGGVRHATLLEKLLIPALAKLSNLVPRGGIWMNTQRPEWNDANNALVGYGLSIVTLAHLRRYVVLLDGLAGDLAGPIAVSGSVVAWMQEIGDILESHSSMAGANDIDAGDRARMLHELGAAYGAYRSSLYVGGLSGPEMLDPALLHRVVGVALLHLDDSVRTARRPDGLYAAYNVLELSPDHERAEVGSLPEMLEGQVAAISSGLLGVEEVADLVRSMYDSELYREDVDSFLLYPARPRPGFLERNQVPAEAVEASPLLAALLAAGSDEIVVRDVAGGYHFHPGFRKADDLGAALDLLAGTPFEPLVEEHRTSTLALFEQVFDHRNFTGRSSTMHAYEGIGSVYWHMVAKLLVAIQECILETPADSADALRDLIDLYFRVRAGLGFNKTATEYGAFPTDPYSHTPAHAGAQQPGMTGQVKEELLTRWAELGLAIEDGTIRFTPALVRAEEFRTEPGEWRFRDQSNTEIVEQIDSGCFGYTVCQVPVIAHLAGDAARIVIAGAAGAEREAAGWVLDVATARDIFGRTGRVTRLDVYFPPDAIERPMPNGGTSRRA